MERLTTENAKNGMMVKCVSQGKWQYFRIMAVNKKTIKVSYYEKDGKVLKHTDEKRPCKNYLQLGRIIYIVKK